MSKKADKADGIDAQLFEDLAAQIYVKGCGGTAKRLDGKYDLIGKHNDRNLYKQKNGQGHIYFDQIWRLGRDENLETFVYKNITELEAELVPENSWDADDPTAMPEPVVVDEWLKRWEALQVFRRVHQSRLPEHADAICAMMQDAKDMVRLEAVTSLGRLAQEHLERYADTIVEFLANEKKDNVREAAVKALINLHQDDLAKHATQLIGLFADESSWVRLWALEGLGSLETDELRKYEDILEKRKLEDDYGPIREKAHQLLKAHYIKTGRPPGWG